MRVGELSRRSGVTVASIKYYLREGLLPPGERTTRTRPRTTRGTSTGCGWSGRCIEAFRRPLGRRDRRGARRGRRPGGPPARGPRPGRRPRRHRRWPGRTTTRPARPTEPSPDLVHERGWHVGPHNPAWHTAVEVLATYHRLGDDDLARQLGLYAEAMEDSRGGRSRPSWTGRPRPHRRGRRRRHGPRRHPAGGAAPPRAGALLRPAPRASGPPGAGLASAIMTSSEARPAVDFPSRVGVWWSSDAWTIGAACEVARDIERMGYGSLFYGEAYGRRPSRRPARS